MSHYHSHYVPPPSAQPVFELASREATQQSPTSRDQQHSGVTRGTAVSQTLSQQQVPPVLEEFLLIRTSDYNVCKQYCETHPTIWNQDITPLHSMVLDSIRLGELSDAQRLFERYSILDTCQAKKLTSQASNKWFKDLVQNEKALHEFRKNLGTTLRRSRKKRRSLLFPPHKQVHQHQMFHYNSLLSRTPDPHRRVLPAIRLPR